MKLRQKKAHSLSENAYYLDFQNQNFQTLNKKTEPPRKLSKDKSLSSTLIDTNKAEYAQILANFINNVNLAKQSQRIKQKGKQTVKNLSYQTLAYSKRLRKPSENSSFDEQKKVQHTRSSQRGIETLCRKANTEQKSEKPMNLFSINKAASIATESQNKKKEWAEQNIINNCLLGNSINLTDYARFVQSPLFGFSPQLMNAWFQLNPYFKPDWEHLPFFAQDMKSGLQRQFQIYQRFKPQTKPSQISNKSLPLTILIQNKNQKVEKKPPNEQRTKRISPDKVFKRASYHVGIAYSIYMDNIQKEGRQIKNFADIDPTRFAKKYKLSQQKQ